MKTPDPRYANERLCLDVALRMIGHEARTCTIKSCTGLSDDRIRRLYARYFKRAGISTVRRQRGRSPSRTRLYVKSPHYQLEAGALMQLFRVFGLIGLDEHGYMRNALNEHTAQFGHRFCLAYETYREIHRAPRLCFERAWSLLRALVEGDELIMMCCAVCEGFYIHHILEIDAGCCPCCKLLGERPRPGAYACEDLDSRRRHAARRAALPAPD